MMKFINCFFILIISIFCSLHASAAIMQGGVSENSSVQQKYNRVIDKKTQIPVTGAKVRIPQIGYSTYTDNYGKFSVPSYTPQNSILSVQKQNYKPFSITINEKNIGKPLSIGIEKSNKFDIVIDTDIYHIGDDNYSNASANASQFRSKAVGPVYRKSFFMPTATKNKTSYLVIGSIIGIDTALARGMGQNNITTSFASPPKVFFNGQKIAEIQINGDNQKIKIPNYLIKPNQQNEIKIAAGINLQQTAYIDFDDIEFMNINIE